MHFGNPGKASQQNVFDAGLRRGCHGDGVSIAAQPRRYPENVDFSDWLAGWAVSHWLNLIRKSQRLSCLQNLLPKSWKGDDVPYLSHSAGHQFHAYQYNRRIAEAQSDLK
jgi:DNA-directed RNA polymerase specialized sigma24 family protein